MFTISSLVCLTHLGPILNNNEIHGYLPLQILILDYDIS